MSRSVAGTVSPAVRQRRARSYALFQTSSVIASSGSTRSNSRRVFFSRSPPAPFQSSNRTTGHQQALPSSSTASTLARTARSPSGRSRWIHDEVSTSTMTDSASPSAALQFFDGDQIRARPGAFGEFGHTAAMIELGDGRHDRFPLGARPRESYGILQLAIRNIYCRLHDSSLGLKGFQHKPSQPGAKVRRIHTANPHTIRNRIDRRWLW